MKNDHREDKDKVVFISDYWSLEQLIDAQNRRTSERNAESIRRIEDLRRRLAECLEKDRDKK